MAKWWLAAALTVASATGAALTANPDVSSAEAAVAAATAAAKEAWVAEAKVKELAAANAKYVPMVEAQIETAKAAAKAAAESDAEAAKLLEETRGKARAAALEAAQAYFAEVKAASSAATKQAFAMQKGSDANVKAAATKAAAEAGRPYHAALLRGQKVVVDYTQHYQALGAAGIRLQAEAVTLANSAEQYQMMGQAAQAQQIMMTAHTLLSQGEAMRKEAEQLRASAEELQESLPLYQQAERAAVANAAQEASVASPTLKPMDIY